MFANPGSTEVPFLAGLPDDLRFVLALHEGARGRARDGLRDRARRAGARRSCTRRPGSGNAVGALATARVNRAPLVVVVGQQDRRHLVFEPFLAGRLHGLAGEYPVWVDQPVRAQDVPGRGRAGVPRGSDGARPRARDRADGRLARSPPTTSARTRPRGRVVRAAARRTPRRSTRSRRSSRGAVAGARRRRGCGRPGDLGRARRARRAARRACLPGVVRRPRRLPAGPPPLRGVLPADRPRLRERLAPYDVVARRRRAGVFRQSP